MLAYLGFVAKTAVGGELFETCVNGYPSLDVEGTGFMRVYPSAWLQRRLRDEAIWRKA